MKSIKFSHAFGIVLRTLPEIVIIIFAITVTIINPSILGQYDGWERLITALVVLLAVNSLIERFIYLRKIERNTQAINDKVSPIFSADSLFKSRADPPGIEKLIGSAKKEIWLFGVTLNSIPSHLKLLKKKLEAGCKIRFLLMDALSDDVLNITKYYVESPRTLADRLKTNVEEFKERLGNSRK